MAKVYTLPLNLAPMHEYTPLLQKTKSAQVGAHAPHPAWLKRDAAAFGKRLCLPLPAVQSVQRSASCAGSPFNRKEERKKGGGRGGEKYATGSCKLSHHVQSWPLTYGHRSAGSPRPPAILSQVKLHAKKTKHAEWKPVDYGQGQLDALGRECDSTYTCIKMTAQLPLSL